MLLDVLLIISLLWISERKIVVPVRCSQFNCQIPRLMPLLAKLCGGIFSDDIGLVIASVSL